MNPAPAKPLLLHYHIFKNAGTSFNHALHRVFGNRFAEYDSPSPDGRLSAKELTAFLQRRPQIEALSSHQTTLPLPQIGGRALCGTILLREPLARIRSIYAFERRQNARTRGAVNAKRLDFKGYVEWRLDKTPVTICNFQVFFCSSAHTRNASAPTELDLKVAMRNLRQLDVVGVVERYDEWLKLARLVLRRHFPGISLISVRANATRAGDEGGDEVLRAELGAELLGELQRRNALDVRLHEFASGFLSQRLAALQPPRKPQME